MTRWAAIDLGSSRRRTDAPRLPSGAPQHLIVNKSPGILHPFDHGAFVGAVAGSILQAVAQRGQQLCLVAFFFYRLPLLECCAPAEIDGLATGSA
jgi:hypothetical protein